MPSRDKGTIGISFCFPSDGRTTKHQLPRWRRILHVHWNDYPDHSLIIALLGGFSGVGGGPFYGTGYYGGGGLGLVVVILLILLLLGRL
jgi:hypothetical protein